MCPPTGLYGPEGILPARRTLRPQGKGRWQQLWETPTLLWEAPLLGLDTAQGLELLSLLGTVLALGALLTRQLRHPLVYLLLWAAYLSVCQVGQVFLYFQWDSLLLETGFLAMLVAPLGLPPNHKQAPQGRPGGVSPHEGLPFWLVRWLLFRLMFASGVVKLTSRCPAWWGLTALTYHYETQCLPTPAAWFAHHLPVWLHKLSVVATFLIEIAVPPLFFAPVRRLRLAAFYSQVDGVLSHQKDKQDVTLLCTAQRAPLGMGVCCWAVRRASWAEELISLGCEGVPVWRCLSWGGRGG